MTLERNNVKNNMIHISFKNSPYELKLYEDILKHSERLGQSAWCKDVLAEKLYGGLDLDSKNNQEPFSKQNESAQNGTVKNSMSSMNSMSGNAVNHGIMNNFKPFSFMEN